MRRNSPLINAVLFYSLRLPDQRGKWRVVHWLRSVLRLDVDEDCQERRAGLKWVLNPADYAQEGIFWLGEADRYEIRHILRLLPRDAVIFGVGANIGYYSLTLAHRLGPAATIYSFEPNPPTLARLYRHVEMNGFRNIHIQGVGLGDHEGSARIQERSGNSGMATLREGDGATVTTLDRFVEQNEITRLDFMKVDIEGYEARMLAGGRKTLATLRPIVQIELNPSALRAAGSTVREITGALRDSGYELYEVHRDELVPLAALPDGENFINAWCVHPEKRPMHWTRGSAR